MDPMYGKQIPTLDGREGKSMVTGAGGWDWKERGIDGGGVRLSRCLWPLGSSDLPQVIAELLPQVI